MALFYIFVYLFNMWLNRRKKKKKTSRDQTGQCNKPQNLRDTFIEYGILSRFYKNSRKNIEIYLK